MPVYATTDPETIREALAERLEAIKPTLAWQQGARWTWAKDSEIVGGATLRTFDLLVSPQREAKTESGGRLRAWGGGIEWECQITLRASYPVREAELPRFMGSDTQDLTAILVRLQEIVPGLMPFETTQDRAVSSASSGDDGRYIGELTFVLTFFARAEVAVA